MASLRSEKPIIMHSDPTFRYPSVSFETVPVLIIDGVMALSLPHPSFYPDLATCAIVFLFPHLKKCVSERRLNSRSALGSAVVQYLDYIPKEDYNYYFFKHALEQWIQRLKKVCHCSGT